MPELRMNIFNDLLLEMEEYKRILQDLKEFSPVSVTGPSDSQKVHLSCALSTHLDRKALFVTYNDMQARRVYEDASFFLGEDNVLYFPPREILLHDVEARSNDTIYQRINTLGRILDGNFEFVVTSIEALAFKMIPSVVFRSFEITIDESSTVDLPHLQSKLVSMGYERVPEVEGKGQFSVRGGIIDIFPVNLAYPVRIELFGDEIDSVRSFDPDTQRSVDRVQKVRIFPARDIIYAGEETEIIIGRIMADLKAYRDNLKKENSSVLKSVSERVNHDIERIRNNINFPGIDRYVPYVVESPVTIDDYITGDVIVFLDEPVRQRQRIENMLLEYYEQCKDLMQRGYLLPGGIENQFNYDMLQKRLEKKCTVALNVLSSQGSHTGGKRYSITGKTLGSYEGHFNLLVEDVRIWKAGNKYVIILAGSEARGQRLVENLRSYDIEAVYVAGKEYKMAPGLVVVTEGALHRGFEYTSPGLVVISDSLLGRAARKTARIRTSKKTAKIDLFTELTPGDYVVHQTHGIGKYVGIEKLVVDNVKRDYIKISYLGGDFLYIPTDQMDLIQKYVGTEGKAPKLSRLGGSDWSRTKNKVKESLKELAQELIQLYAKRQALKGYAFSPDTVWQKQFEDMFPYEETEDQLRCIEEIKRDMESDRPVDRLLCGDVGYGKTEVALRAVFKAVMDGKQVAYLCPTTVLAQQHYNTFKKRMEDFPVRVEVLSRFRSRAEQKQILKDVRNGNIDVLIGTHRILQKDVKFKDLALLVVDEEQRFGVEHKEKIKNLSPNIDVLTLTATPIPRTLHMSLIGIRDISVIENPPEERYPVQTYVMEYDEEVIRDAILREIARKGQVFYLYNRVRAIELRATRIANLIPGIRVAVAHGQMNETHLEKVMMDFMNGEYDVLVCTTIIESGLDMPNVNTIIVEDADKMGLAQLYQLRGRVGRSNRLAYAYITYKKDKVLTEEAEKRLKAIREFTEFGSGFKIAMRDLEIRGAGNILGPQQHGHIASVGYDMYCRLLDQAVKELKGITKQEKQQEISIDINVDAYIGDDYIESEILKIEMYKKIASIENDDDVMEIRDELIDRFGDIPPPVDNLIKIAGIKALAADIGLSSVAEKDGGIILQFREIPNWLFGAISGIINKYRGQILFNASKNPYLLYKTGNTKRENLLDSIKILLQDIKSFEVV